MVTCRLGSASNVLLSDMPKVYNAECCVSDSVIKAGGWSLGMKLVRVYAPVNLFALVCGSTSLH